MLTTCSGKIQRKTMRDMAAQDAEELKKQPLKARL